MGASQLEKKLHRHIQGDLHVHLKAYSATELRGGLFKQLTIEGQDLVYDHALYVHAVHLKTDTQTAQLEMTMTKEDIANTLASSSVRKRLAHINIPLAGFGKQQLQVISPQVSLSPNHIHTDATIAIAGQSVDQAVPISINTGLAISEDSKRLQLQGLTITTPYPGFEAASDYIKTPLERFLDPTTWLPKQYKQSNVQIQSLDITPDQLVLSAHLTLMPPLAKSPGVR
jgi:hypothetical protein